MQHITFEGTHFEMGFHWGSLLAKRGIFILERIPFPLTEERAAFAEHCLPAYQAYFPQILEEIQGIALGQGCSALSLQAALFSMYALPPACHCSCFAVSNEEHILFGRNSDFLTGLERDCSNMLYRFPRESNSYSFMGDTTSFIPNGGRRQRSGAGCGAGVHLSLLYPARDERRDVASLFPGEVRHRPRGAGMVGKAAHRFGADLYPCRPNGGDCPAGVLCRRGGSAVPHGGTPLCLRRQPVSRPQSSGEKCPCY